MLLRPIVFARLALVLLAVIAAEALALYAGGGGAPPVPVRALTPPAPVAQRRTGPDVAELVEDVLARPLFSPDRRPVAEAPTAQPTASGPAGLPRLAGIMVGNGVKAAIFAGAGDGKPVVVGENGKIGAYVVQSIGKGGATVLGPSGVQTLRPSFDPNGVQAVVTQPVQQQGFFAQPGVNVQPAAAGQQAVLDALRRAPQRPGGNQAEQ